MSAHEEEKADEVEVEASGGNEENCVRVSPDLIDERIRANLEPLPTQISALTEKMDRSIQGNSARELTTASSREPRHTSESPFSGAPGTSRFPTLALLATAGCSPHTGLCRTKKLPA